MDDNDEHGDERQLPTGEAGHYEIGYRKPPLHSRFQKGRSGNPSGRPKGRKTFVDFFVKALSRKQAVDLDGQVVMMEMREIGAYNWGKKFGKGDPEALRLGMQFDPYFVAKPEEKDRALWFTLKVEENDPGPHWQLIEEGRVIDEG